MKSILIVLILTAHSAYPGLKNSTWNCKITDKCINTLKFKTDKDVYKYDCELDYTFHCTYMISGDTLIISEKDDSHSEDGGKPTFYKSRYIMRRNGLYGIGYSEKVGDKWKTVNSQPDKEPTYTRSGK